MKEYKTKGITPQESFVLSLIIIEPPSERKKQ